MNKVYLSWKAKYHSHYYYMSKCYKATLSDSIIFKLKLKIKSVLVYHITLCRCCHSHIFLLSGD